MLPMCFANDGEEVTVKKISGTPEVKKHLENLGFVPGSTISVISKTGGNMIVKVKESRVAVSETMARRTLV